MGSNCRLKNDVFKMPLDDISNAHCDKKRSTIAHINFQSEIRVLDSDIMYIFEGFGQTASSRSRNVTDLTSFQRYP